MRCWEGNHRGKWHSYQIISKVQTSNMTQTSNNNFCCWPWSLPRWSLSDFTLQLLLCSHFRHCILWKEVTILSQHLRSGSYVPPHWVESLYNLFGVILHGRFVYCLTLIYLFNNVFISVWTYGYLFCIWDYSSILICLFCCSNRFTFGHWELVQRAPVSIWYTSHQC